MSDSSTNKIERERYRVLIENAPEVVVVLDLETNKFVECNQNALLFFKLTREELYAKGPVEVSPEFVFGKEASFGAENYIAKALKGGNPVFDWVHIDSEGNEIPCEVRLIRFPPYDKQLIRASIIDITDRIKIEQQLIYQASLIENVLDAVIGIDNEFRITSWNKAAENMYGWTTEEVFGKGLNELVQTAYLSISGEEVLEAFLKKGNWRGEVIQKNKAGEKLFVYASVSAIKNPEGDTLGAISVNRDVTERKRTQQELSEITERLRISTKAAKVGIWDWDPREDILIWDQTMFDLYSMKQDEFTGKAGSWIGQVHPEDKRLARRDIGLALRGDKEFDSEFRIVWPDQSVRYIKGLGTVHRNENGTAIRMVGTNWDITREKEAEDQKIRARQLELKNKELEQFAYVASHDLQEPLRTVTGFVGLLKKRYHDKLDAQANEHLEFISQAGSRMSNLIKALLDYSRIGSNKGLSMVDCNVLVQNILDDLDAQITETHATLVIEKLPRLTGYETELRMLFQNLISNAIKFRKENEPPSVRIFAIRKVNHWEFCITDNGIGIDPEHREKIFVIFQRLYTRGNIEGTGIGLAHCQKIVDLHGGKIWLDSTPGEGAAFYFTIPDRQDS